MQTAIILILAVAVFGTIIGFAIGYYLRKLIAKGQVGSAEIKAEKILTEAKNKGQEYLVKVKERALKLIDDTKKDESLRRKEIQNLQKRLENREGVFDQKLLDFQEKQQKLLEKATRLEEVKKEIQNLRDEEMKKLQQIAGLSPEGAKHELMGLVSKDSEEELMSLRKKLENQNSEELEKKAREVLMPVIERMAGSVVAESTTTNVDLPSDEMKGRIIGKEGRNIKVIEQLTGTEILIDETPEVITISSFSPIRRQLAKRALDKLIADGRIQPARIEETIQNVKKELAIEITKAGEDALYKLGLTGLDQKLVQIIGRLKFRTSYGQNILLHSIEVASIATMLAEELGADVTIAKKGGLLHDIGKAMDQDIQGGHPEIGYKILKKFGIAEDVAYIALGHHEDHPKTLEAVIVKVADAISGARIGARKDSFEQYVKRLEELEGIAKAFQGVDKAYAIQAGREIRVFVKPDQIDDYSAHELAKNIANQIETDLKYPGEIKVMVIREKRIIEYAK
ncbi:ribonuclease Y [Patescibacteria group bacterium]|nr:ribonuclease Y [Patescibacteria group bacterium]